MKEIIRDKIWNDFIINKIECNIFHTLEWENLLKKEYGFLIKRYCITDKNGEIICGCQFCNLKNKLVALPFSDYYNIVSNEESYVDIFIKELLSKITSNQNLLIKSLVENDNFECHNEAVIHFGYYKSPFSEVEKLFAYNHKWGVKKAKKEGLYTRYFKDYEGIKIYYELHLMTRQRQGTPSQSFNFFKSLLDFVISKNLGIICIVYKDEIPVAGGVFLYFNKTFTHKYGASDFRYWKLQPNNLMLYEMIKYAVENGFEIFDFGKTEVNNTGLRKFKSGWGAVEKPLYYSYYPEYKQNKLFDFAKDKIVTPLIKHSPRFVCRGIGELFYKYTV